MRDAFYLGVWWTFCSAAVVFGAIATIRNPADSRWLAALSGVVLAGWATTTGLILVFMPK